MKAIYYLALSTGLLMACSDTSKNSGANEGENTDSLRAVATESADEFAQKVFYPIPSPEQMFSFINEVGINYSKALIQDPKKAQTYNDPTALSLNFGVYTADLAYSAAYKDIETTAELYQIVDKMAADMGIDEMMDEVVFKEVKRNLQNRDSLSVIAGRAYYEAVAYLEQNEMQGKLALMSLGGWVESLYITTNAISEFEEGSPAAQRIADQKITFGNLYTFLKKHKNERGVSEAIKGLKSIRSIFASLPESRTAKSSKDELGGKMVLSSSRKISINKAQFDSLKAAISQYRNSITSADKIKS